MRLQVGTWPWLLAHEIRLAWRGFFTRNLSLMLLLFALLWIVWHIPAYLLMRSIPADVMAGTGFVVIVAGLFFWFGFTLMLSTAIVLSVNALYDRGDLDLLISSPCPTSTIFIVRGLGVALNAVALIAAFALPFAHMGIVTGNPGMIAAYPVLLGIALGAAGLAFAVTLLLARWLGARRARVIGQVMSAIVGASLFLASQSANLVSDEIRESWTPVIVRAFSTGWLGPESPLWWPVRALFGDPLAVVATLGAGAALFLFVTGLTSKAFVSGTQESTTAPARPEPARTDTRFRGGLARVVIDKELRLIRRDPNLIAKTLIQGLYLLPLIFIMARRNDLATILAPGIIVLLAGVAGNLAWITISAEEAPDLIGSAPVNREKVRWLKAAAALKPLIWVAAPFVIFYLLTAPLRAFVFGLFLALALLASAVTQVWGGKPAPKRDLKARQKENMGLNFAEVISTLALAATCWLVFETSRWAFAVFPIGLLAPGTAWLMRRRDAE